MSCPYCGHELENYTNQEGGYCPKCETWFPADVVEDCMENEIEDFDELEEISLWGEESLASDTKRMNENE